KKTEHVFLLDSRQQLIISANPFAYCPKEDTYLRLQMVQHIFGQIVSTVAWLHSKRICHLDLSLENVLIRNEDIFHPQIQIIDFGVSVDFSNNNDSNHNEEEEEEQKSNANTNTNANNGVINDSMRTRQKRDSTFDMNCDKHGDVRHCENVGKPGYKAFEVRMSDETRRKVRIAEVSAKRAQLLLACMQMQQQQCGVSASLEVVIHMYDMLLRDGIKDSYDPFKADIWTLGVILYLLLFCRYPFRHADLDDDMFLVILQKRLLQYLLEQKALCWITFETFDILNQMLQPEFARINIAQLSMHPFCSFLGSVQSTNNADEAKKEHAFQNIKKNKGDIFLGMNHVITAQQQADHGIKYNTNKTSVLTTPLLHCCSANQNTVAQHSTTMTSSILQRPSNSIVSQFF
ncbi:death-associated protein kinase 1, partial [Reticulomyxa filosa]